MKKYIGVVIGIAFAIGAVSIASAQFKCDPRKGGCVDRVDNTTEILCFNGRQNITWSGPTELWGFCAHGGGGNNGHFMSRDACNKAYCEGFKSSISSLGSSAFAGGSSGLANPILLTPEKAAIRKRVLDIVARSVAPSVSAPVAAHSAVAGVVRSASPSAVAPVSADRYRATAPAYTAPVPRASVMTAPPASYYADWMKPKPAPKCDAISPEECRRDAFEVQGNSMGTPKNTCEWREDLPVGRQCVTVQLP